MAIVGGGGAIFGGFCGDLSMGKALGCPNSAISRPAVLAIYAGAR